MASTLYNIGMMELSEGGSATSDWDAAGQTYRVLGPVVYLFQRQRVKNIQRKR